MRNMSVRTRVILMILLFSAVGVALSVVSISSLSDIQEKLREVIDVRASKRFIATALSRDFEAMNAEQNALMSATSAEEYDRRMQAMDRFNRNIDQSLATMDKLVTAEEQGAIEQVKKQLDEYKAIDVRFRKVLLSGETEKAVALYVNEHPRLVAKIRDQVRRSTEGLDHAKSPQVALLVRDLQIALLSASNALGDMVIETREPALGELALSSDSLLRELGSTLDQLRDDPEGQRIALRIASPLDDYRKLHAEISEAARANSRARAIQLSNSSDAHVANARAAIQQIVTEATAKLEAAQKGVDELSSRARALQIILSLVGLALGATFAVLTVLRVHRGVEAVRRVASDVADNANQLRFATQGMSQRTNEEAASLEEASSTMEEMTATVEQNRVGALKARGIAEQTREAAGQGAATSAQAADAMRVLKDVGTKISEISDTVSELAFQTNILALNATVEAARAGEHGRGFTVVAAEVRTLAQRSAQAAREISALIKESTQRIDRGVDAVSRSSNEMKRIVEGSGDVNQLVGNISAAAQEQATGITQVTQAILQLNQVVQANNAQAEEIAATGENLATQSQELLRAIELISGEDETALSRLTSMNRGYSAAVRQSFPQNGMAKHEGESKPSQPPAEPIHSSPRATNFKSF